MCADLRWVFVELGQLLGESRELDLLLKMPQGGAVDLHALDVMACQLLHLTEHFLRLQHQHHVCQSSHHPQVNVER